MMWRPLLFLFLSMSPSGGLDETCLAGSGRTCERKDCVQVAKLCNQTETGNDIFHCDSEEIPAEDRLEEFNEGDIIKIAAEGDFLGHGCSFEVKNTDSGVTCCYIRETREDQRRGEVDGLKLCNETEQPQECRQPGSGKYEVREIPGKSRWCQLLLIGAMTDDSGVYKVKFPADPTKEPKEITVAVKTEGFSALEATFIGLGVAVGGVVVILLLVLFALKPRTPERELEEREEDETILKEIKRGITKGDDKKRFGLRDKNYNNIYHFASNDDRMRDIVLREDKRFRQVGTKDKDEEAATTTTPSSSRIQNIKLRLYRWWLDVTPYYLWPHHFPHPTALDSKNIYGDTPLMIAAEHGQKDLVQIMLDNNADVNKKNNWGETALQRTIACYTRGFTKESKYTKEEEESKELRNARHEIVEMLLEKGANVTGHISDNTLLHTAVKKNSIEIVKLLAHPEKKENLLLIGEKSSDAEKETAFQLSVRLGFEDIAEFLIDQDVKTKERWNKSDEEIVKTVYPAVQAGHVKILTMLMEKGNLVCNDSRGALLKRAVKENNQSALGFLFSKYYNPIAHTVLPASEDELDRLRISDITMALTDAIEKKKNKTFENKIKGADYLVGWLSRESLRRRRNEGQLEDLEDAPAKAAALAKEMKEDFTKHGRLTDSDTIQYMIVELSTENETLQITSPLLKQVSWPPGDSDMRKKALVLMKEKKAELEKSLRSSKWIVEKLSEEERTARALEIAKEKKKKDFPKESDKEACQFVMDWLSLEFQPDDKDKQPKSDPRLIAPVKALLKTWQREFKEEETKLEVIEHAITKFEKKVQKEREWLAVDETEDAQQSSDPLSRRANENENPDDELKRTREAQKEKRKEKAELAQKIRNLTKKYTSESSNKELFEGMAKFMEDFKEMKMYADELAEKT